MNATRPDVTVVIPCYKGEKFVADAIASVLSQSGGTLEVVVVDDGSPDRSAELVAAVADERVRLLRHDRNRGIAAARNTGLRAARADFVAFLDQDDLWLPGRLAAQLAAFAADPSGEVGLVFCRVSVIDRRGRTTVPRDRVPRGLRDLTGTRLLERLVAHNFVPFGAALVRRRCLDAAGPFDETILGGSDDFDMVIRLAEHGRFEYLPRPLFVRRLHDENYTHPERMIEESLRVIDRVEQRHSRAARAARIGRGRKLYKRARNRQASGNSRGAAHDFRLALAQWPWQPRAWAGLLLCALGPAGDSISKAWFRVRPRP